MGEEQALAAVQDGYPDRVNIPLTDEGAHVTFYVIKRETDRCKNSSEK